MKRTFWLFAILIHTCLIASAQTFAIHGKVIDPKTRQGITYANVYIEGNIQTSTATDSIGQFKINHAKPGIHQLVVSCIGYKSKLTSEYMARGRAELFPLYQSHNPTVLYQPASLVDRLSDRPWHLELGRFRFGRLYLNQPAIHSLNRASYRCFQPSTNAESIEAIITPHIG